MLLRVVGCHGGETPKHLTTCFCVDDNILLDAGSVARGLSLDQQAAIDHVILSHGHHDHVAGLAGLADNVVARRTKPITIHCSKETGAILTSSLFNNRLWPDFTRIPTPQKPVLRIKHFSPGTPFKVGRYTVDTVPVNHTIECAAIILKWRGGALAYSGDTGPTDKLFAHLRRLRSLRALIYETSFPDEMAELAERTGHLTPASLAHELDTKLPRRDGVRILITHIKPGTLGATTRQLRALKDPGLTILRPGQRIRL